jgi:hypothetical protein
MSCSAWKSGPVPVFYLFGSGPQPDWSSIKGNSQKTRPKPKKNHKKPVRTSLNWFTQRLRSRLVKTGHDLAFPTFSYILLTNLTKNLANRSRIEWDIIKTEFERNIVMPIIFCIWLRVIFDNMATVLYLYWNFRNNIFSLFQVPTAVCSPWQQERSERIVLQVSQVIDIHHIQKRQPWISWRHVSWNLKLISIFCFSWKSHQ